MSRQFATIYDIFCPVPFLPSPFGFRRCMSIREKMPVFPVAPCVEMEIFLLEMPFSGLVGNAFPALVDVLDIFYLFFCSGRGKGESEAPGGRGGRFFIENTRRGGGVSRRESGRGAGRVSAANWGIGGGATYLFSGPKCPPSRGFRLRNPLFPSLGFKNCFDPCGGQTDWQDFCEP